MHIFIAIPTIKYLMIIYNIQTDLLHNCFNNGPGDTLLLCVLICFINCINDVVIAPGLVVIVTFSGSTFSD